MPEADGMAYLVQKDTANIGDDRAVGGELQRSPVGVEALRAVKKDIGVDKTGANRAVVGNCESVSAEGFAENGAGENYGVQAIARSCGHGRVQDRGCLDPLNVLIPHIQGGSDSGIPGGIAILQSRVWISEVKLEQDHAAGWPAWPFESVPFRLRADQSEYRRRNSGDISRGEDDWTPGTKSFSTKRRDKLQCVHTCKSSRSLSGYAGQRYVIWDAGNPEQRPKI